jgi:predicted nucleotidyltransferase
MLSPETLTALQSLAPTLAPRGVTGLSVFGSRTTGEAGPDSDIDIIVDYDPDSHFSLLDLVAVGRLIEERLGIRADVMTRPGLHPVLKHAIEAQEVRVY